MKINKVYDSRSLILTRSLICILSSRIIKSNLQYLVSFPTLNPLTWTILCRDDFHNLSVCFYWVPALKLLSMLWPLAEITLCLQLRKLFLKCDQNLSPKNCLTWILNLESKPCILEWTGEASVLLYICAYIP